VPKLIAEIKVPDLPPTIPDAFAKFSTPDHAVHQRRYGVRYSDLDINQHANNVCYAEWAVESVPEEILATHHLHRLELHFKAETTFGDYVQARTARLDGDDSAFTHHLLRESDARDVAIARTKWRLQNVSDS
jgi:acyl-ACP thioesterase